MIGCQSTDKQHIAKQHLAAKKGCPCAVHLCTTRRWIATAARGSSTVTETGCWRITLALLGKGVAGEE
jgi:hypothetical protein